MQEASSPTTNDGYDWHTFDVKAYYQQYLGDVLWEDRGLARATIGALLELGVPLGTLRRGIDACNGGVLRGASLIAPFVADNGTLHWSDYGKPQVEHAKKMIESGRKGNLGPWAQHQTHMGQCHPAWSGASFRACQLGRAVQQSIFDLPHAHYDIGITCFGPESLTANKDEWRRAVVSFFDSIHPGGAAIMLYMVNSTGYSSAGLSLPALPIDHHDVLGVARPALTKLQTFFVDGASSAVRPDEDPHGYDGMGLIIGLKR